MRAAHNDSRRTHLYPNGIRREFNLRAAGGWFQERLCSDWWLRKRIYHQRLVYRSANWVSNENFVKCVPALKPTSMQSAVFSWLERRAASFGLRRWQRRDIT